MQYLQHKHFLDYLETKNSVTSINTGKTNNTNDDKNWSKINYLLPIIKSLFENEK